MTTDVFVLLLGATPAAYALAASFAGDYGVPVTVMDDEIDDAFYHSVCVSEVRRVPGITRTSLLLRALTDFYEAHRGRSLLLLPLTASYAKALEGEREVLERMFLMPQKASLFEGEPVPFPKALLLAYRGREGKLVTAYGRVVAQTEEGVPLALVTEQAPEALLSVIPEEKSGFSLYAVKNNGNLCALLPYGEISPFCAFATAQDTSLAEWMLFDYVLCSNPVNKKADAEALFSLFPYRRWRKLVPQKEKTRIKLLRRQGLSVSIFSLQNERKKTVAHHRLRRFYQEVWEKTEKAKK